MKHGNPDAWNFTNTDTNLLSPDSSYRIQYGQLHEIAMGAPIAGSCYLLHGNTTTELVGMYGGPAVWNTEGTKAAIPLWTKDRDQKICVLDVVLMTITTYKTVFRVLELACFEEDMIYGTDSPIYMKSDVNFNTCTEEIESIKQL